MSRKRRCASRAISAFDLPVSGNSHAIDPDVSTRSTRTRDSTNPLTSSVAVRNGSAAAKITRASAPATSTLGIVWAARIQSRLRYFGSMAWPECCRLYRRRRAASRTSVAAAATATSVVRAKAIPTSP